MNILIHGLVTALILGACICLKVYGQTLYPGESATVYCIMPFSSADAKTHAYTGARACSCPYAIRVANGRARWLYVRAG